MRRVLIATALTGLIIGGSGCRDMLGGQAVDSLQKTKTAAARSEGQADERYRQGLEAADEQRAKLRQALDENQ